VLTFVMTKPAQKIRKSRNANAAMGEVRAAGGVAVVYPRGGQITDVAVWGAVT
jgi:hypothetical protein